MFHRACVRLGALPFRSGRSLSSSTGAVTQKPWRVGVVGSGISGLALAGILSTEKRIHVTVLERASPDRDQGYGLDIDATGQEALELGGVYDRFWDISRKGSDVLKICPTDSVIPMLVSWRPWWFDKVY